MQPVQKWPDRVSVGEVMKFGLVANFIGVVGLFMGSLLGMNVALILIAVKRGQISPTKAERPLVAI